MFASSALVETHAPYTGRASAARRHALRPGVTGWAQINGSRGPLHDAAGVARRVQLDVDYIERASVWFDFIII